MCRKSSDEVASRRQVHKNITRVTDLITGLDRLTRECHCVYVRAKFATLSLVLSGVLISTNFR